MFFINTKDKLKAGIRNIPFLNLKVYSAVYKLRLLANYCFLFIFVFCMLNYLSGCSSKDQLQETRDYIKQSEDYYQRAIAGYLDLIERGQNLEQVYFELGLLYFKRAEYDSANNYLSKTWHQRYRDHLTGQEGRGNLFSRDQRQSAFEKRFS